REAEEARGERKGRVEVPCRVADLVPGELFRWRLPNFAGPNLAISPDGRLAVFPEGESHTVLELGGQHRIRRFTTNWVMTTPSAFFPDNRLILSAGSDKLFHIWDVETGQDVRQFAAPPTTVRSLALSADG